MGSVLPNPRNQPRFRIDGNGDVPQNEDLFPCEVRDFVVDSQTWIPYIAQANQRTVRGVLEHDGTDWERNCFVCEQNWENCPKQVCVRTFHALRRSADYAQQFQIRNAGTMGLGVFAGRPLLKGDLLDEYFGELLPQIVAAQRGDDAYSFKIKDVASSSSRDYGNWTRFVNHRCVKSNVEAVDDVVGGRRTIAFKALRSIRRGEQLYIDYGLGYFGDAQSYILCKCPDFPGDHLPPGQRGTKRKADTQATPSGTRKKRVRTRKRPDLTIPEQNAWITEEKEWLSQEAPNGSPDWTRLHWRLLEQLIRRRRNHSDWRDKREFGKLTTSRGDPLINQLISKRTRDDKGENRVNVQMTIKAWHLDVTKAFEKDAVCGSKQGVPWGTDELLKRVFAIIVAARRRRRRAGRKNSFSVTPPLSAAPVTPETSGGALAGAIPTPPPTGGRVQPEASSKLPPFVPAATDGPSLPSTDTAGFGRF